MADRAKSQPNKFGDYIAESNFQIAGSLVSAMWKKISERASLELAQAAQNKIPPVSLMSQCKRQGFDRLIEGYFKASREGLFLADFPGFEEQFRG